MCFDCFFSRSCAQPHDFPLLWLKDVGFDTNFRLRRAAKHCPKSVNMVEDF